MQDLEKIYTQRFNKEDQKKKMELWKVLCSHFFQRYVKKSDTVLDLAAGYCEFINNIECKHKIALDLRPDLHKFAGKDVKIVKSSSIDMKKIKSNSVDVVFTSNFFEHLSKDEGAKTVDEVRRILRKNGKFIILQPNIKYTYDVYWDFVDHVAAYSHVSMQELLLNHDFHIVEVRAKFLPFTTKSRLPQWKILIKTYLKMRIAQNILGKQMLIVASK